MKELSIEQKAKAYNEALKVLHKYDGANIMFSQSLKEEMFPELKESEDERIRKALIHLINEQDGFLTEINGINVKDILTWLEKQGEKKPINDTDEEIVKAMEDTSVLDMVEPKFKVGDWIVSNGKLYVYQIEEINEFVVKVREINGETFVVNVNCLKDAHLWTIQDAKDGDVLAAHECLVLFKEIDGLNIKCYCTYHYMGSNPSFYVDTLQNKTAFYPATKEQHNLLFQKMHEAGFEWDVEKKELNKIGQKSNEWSEEDGNKPNGGIVMEDFNDGNGFYKVNLAYLNKEQVEEIEELVKRWDLQPKGNEDESIINDLLDYFDEDKCLKHEVNDIVKWLKTIKPQQKGWSENEIKMLDNLITYLDGRKNLLEDIKRTYIDWLKSLKDKYTWKPSEAQMKALHDLNLTGNISYARQGQVLIELYNDLKKLKE